MIGELTPALLSARILFRTTDAIFVRLPLVLQREISGGCSCQHCKRNPDLAKWDTLAVPMSDGYDWTYVVHLPDPGVEESREYWRRKGELLP